MFVGTWICVHVCICMCAYIYTYSMYVYNVVEINVFTVLFLTKGILKLASCMFSNRISRMLTNYISFSPISYQVLIICMKVMISGIYPDMLI